MKYSLGLYEKALPKGFSFREMFEITRECGFDRLELSVDETDARLSRLDWSEREQYNLGIQAKEAGVSVRTMCLSGQRKYPMGSHDPAVRRRSMEIMQKAIHFSANAGISIIQLAGYDVYYEEGDEETRARFAENLALAANMAAECGVVLAFETMETPFMDTVEKAMRYVDLVRSPWLGVYPDIGNLKNAAALYGNSVTEDLFKGVGHTFAMHLKETKPGVYRDMNYGTGGHTEYEACIEAGLRMGVRIFTGEFWYQEGQDYRKTVSDAAVFLRGKFDKAMARIGDGL